MKSIRMDCQTARSIGLWGILFVIAVICIVMLSRANIQFARQNPGGTDFLVAWEGMRSVAQGESPYTDTTAQRIQMRAYGRLANPGENELRVPYPIYALIFLLPWSLTTDFSTARGIWMTVVELATVGFAIISIRLSGRIWSRWKTIVFLLFSIVWYFGLRAIINGNVVILVSLLLGVSLFCLEKKWDWAAGVALAGSTFKPQVAIFPIACCLLWLVFTRRYRPVLSFVMTMALFVGIGLLLSPTWISANWSEVLRYPSYNPPGNPESSLQAILGLPGSWLGIMISLGVLVWMAFLWMRLPKADHTKFLNILMLTLALAPLSGLQTDAGNEYILLLPISFCLLPPMMKAISSSIRFIGLLTVLFIGLWGMFILTVNRTDQPVQHPIMLFPLPLFLLLVIGVDWIRNKIHPGLAPG